MVWSSLILICGCCSFLLQERSRLNVSGQRASGGLPGQTRDLDTCAHTPEKRSSRAPRVTESLCEVIISPSTCGVTLPKASRKSARKNCAPCLFHTYCDWLKIDINKGHNPLTRPDHGYWRVLLEYCGRQMWTLIADVKVSVICWLNSATIQNLLFLLILNFVLICNLCTWYWKNLYVQQMLPCVALLI